MRSDITQWLRQRGPARCTKMDHNLAITTPGRGDYARNWFIARTSASEIPGSDSACPASGIMCNRAFGRPCAKAQAEVGGQIMSNRP